MKTLSVFWVTDDAAVKRSLHPVDALTPGRPEALRDRSEAPAADGRQQACVFAIAPDAFDAPMAQACPAARGNIIAHREPQTWPSPQNQAALGPAIMTVITTASSQLSNILLCLLVWFIAPISKSPVSGRGYCPDLLAIFINLIVAWTRRPYIPLSTDSAD